MSQFAAASPRLLTWALCVCEIFTLLCPHGACVQDGVRPAAAATQLRARLTSARAHLAPVFDLPRRTLSTHVIEQSMCVL